MKKRSFIWSLTGIGAVIGFMLTVQISSRTQSSSTGMSSYVDLRTQIQEQLQEHQILTANVSKDNAQLVQYQAASGHREDLLKVLQQDAKSVEAEAGITPVSGPGITLTIQYDPSLPYDAKTAGLFDQLADQEIGLIVNLLFANGARAISINGERLVTTSSILLVAKSDTLSTLQVNTVPVTMPYVIRAVGDVDKMQTVLSANDVVSELELMQERGTLVSNRDPNGVTVPGYGGPLPGTYAKEVNAE
jgi:uncharacterized protein YlxW (UPF0749 family)